MRAQIWHFSGWLSETEPAALFKKYNGLLEASGFCVLSYVEHHFEPHGYTVLFLLSESHFALHTFPEEEQTYFELSSCVEAPFKAFISNLHK